MEFLITLLITAAVTAVSLLIISKVPFLGIEVDSVGKALTAGVVFGVLNVLGNFVVSILRTPLVAILTLGISFLISLIIFFIVFGLTAKLVTGFRLRYGLMSAFMGAIALSIVNSIIFWLVSLIF
ncbi:MAG: phage holin family protein [Synechococcales cyanobacterium T60_A2020_003]|nr:phage holin family protein [Synechococcales cyanobacterium T60_A2020_003]